LIPLSFSSSQETCPCPPYKIFLSPQGKPWSFRED
jgi:hypothetical protein